jgi:hypothetical protein
MELTDRAAHRGDDAALGATVAMVRARFGAHVGRVRVVCPGLPVCRVALDGGALDTSTSTIASVGVHSLKVDRGGSVTSHVVEVRPGATTDVMAPAPARPEPLPAGPGVAIGARERSGLSPAWAYAGLGATAIAGATTLVFGLDATRRHDRFVQDGCAHTSSAACVDAASEGASAQHRTNAAMLTTAALGTVTLVVALVLVRWGPPGGNAAVRNHSALSVTF